MQPIDNIDEAGRPKSVPQSGLDSPPAIEFALQVFGDYELAASWMGEPNPAFHGLTPTQMILKNRQQEVIDTLGRIQSGVLS